MSTFTPHPLASALSEYDDRSAECPFAKPPTPASDKPCPKCKAESNEGCRDEIRAAFAFIHAARAEIEAGT